MMKIVQVLLAAAVISVPGASFSQSLIRERIDDTLNNVQSMLGDDSREHEVRRISDRISLLDTEQRRLLAMIEAKRMEREDLALSLEALGVAAPEPVLLGPVMIPGGEGEPERMCVTTPSGTPLHCW